MKTALRLSWVPVALALIGCGGHGSTSPASQGTLDGDVFIVTQGAENVKLGLVEVRVLPYQDTVSSIAKTKAEVQQQMALLQPKLEAAERASASADAREKAADTAADVAEKDSDAAFEQDLAATSQPINALDSNGHVDFDKLDAEEKKRDAATDRVFAADENRHQAISHAESSARDFSISAAKSLADLRAQARKLNSGANYFANLPAPVTSVKTDADGKFSIPLDKNAHLVLAASATRLVFGKTENYYWLIGVSLGGPPSKKIFLSNDNLATSDSKDSLVHVVE